MGSNSCADQNGGRRESRRLKGIGSNRERPQGSGSGPMLACGETEASRKREMFQSHRAIEW